MKTTELERCINYLECPIRNFKPNKYECDGFGKVFHISSYNGEKMIVDCDDYIIKIKDLKNEIF